MPKDSPSVDTIPPPCPSELMTHPSIRYWYPATLLVSPNCGLATPINLLSNPQNLPEETSCEPSKPPAEATAQEGCDNTPGESLRSVGESVLNIRTSEPPPLLLVCETNAVVDLNASNDLGPDDPCIEPRTWFVLLSKWAPILPIVGVLLLMGIGCYFAKPIRHFIRFFSALVHRWGLLGVLAFFVVYLLLELVMAPVIPLTMMAGAVFDVVPGTIITSLAGTTAAVLSFLIARYVARRKFQSWAYSNQSFRAIDHVIGTHGFRVVVLLRLSPLFPLAASNYLYGLTSVKLPDYALGSWLGMLPGTLTYVIAGKLSRMAISDGGKAPLHWWQIMLALAISITTIIYIGCLAKRALEELEEESQSPTADTAPLMDERPELNFHAVPTVHDTLAARSDFHVL